jgi:hypothetical protein
MNYFDFIHVRELFGCVANWDDFFAQAFEHTKSGGYVEILEHSVWPVSDDDTVDENSFFTLWGKTVIEMGEKFGKSFEIWEQSKERLEKAGFVDVIEVRYKWPMNGTFSFFSTLVEKLRSGDLYFQRRMKSSAP